MITESTRPVGYAEQDTKSSAQPRTSVSSGAGLTLSGELALKVCLHIFHSPLFTPHISQTLQNGNAKQAKQAFETYINSFPSPPKDQYLIRSYYGLGEVYSAEGTQLKGSVYNFFEPFSSKIH